MSEEWTQFPAGSEGLTRWMEAAGKIEEERNALLQRMEKVEAERDEAREQLGRAKALLQVPAVMDVLRCNAALWDQLWEVLKEPNEETS